MKQLILQSTQQKTKAVVSFNQNIIALSNEYCIEKQNFPTSINKKQIDTEENSWLMRKKSKFRVHSLNRQILFFKIQTYLNKTVPESWIGAKVNVRITK